ncbi:MAG: HpcH/HpaI aldolase/citrate lyase family protein [Ilumatobacteraceae bacterium]
MSLERRSWLFVPGDDERKIAKAQSAGADAVVLDLEDAVTTARRPVARAIVGDITSQTPPGVGELWVRINPLDTPDALADLAAVVRPHLAGVVLPKIRRASDVTTLDDFLSALEVGEGMARGSVGIMVVATETPEMMFRLGDLAESSQRLQACTWGAEDLSTAVGASTNKAADGDWDDPYRLARSLCLLAAVAAAVQPVDTVFTELADDAGLAAATRLAGKQGFTGKVAIHPRQVPIINEHFTPSAIEVADAEAVVAAFAARADAGTVAHEGRMLDRPHLVQAERLLARAGAAERRP